MAPSLSFINLGYSWELTICPPHTTLILTRYTGGLVQQLAYGGSDSHGREFDHYAAHQHNMSGGLFG